jgi:hypothetical protein
MKIEKITINDNDNESKKAQRWNTTIPSSNLFINLEIKSNLQLH